jgi:hypothetical protein
MLGCRRQTVGKRLAVASTCVAATRNCRQMIGCKPLANHWLSTSKPLANHWPLQVNRWQMHGRHRQTVGKCLSFTGQLLANAWPSQANYSHHQQTVGKSLTVAGKPLANAWPSQTVTGKPFANAWPSQANCWPTGGGDRQTVGKSLAVNEQAVGKSLAVVGEPLANAWLSQADRGQMLVLHRPTVGKCLAVASTCVAVTRNCRQMLGRKPLANRWLSTSKPLANHWPSQVNRWQMRGCHRQTVGKCLSFTGVTSTRVAVTRNYRQMLGRKRLANAWPSQANLGQMTGCRRQVVGQCWAVTGKPLANPWPSQANR